MGGPGSGLSRSREVRVAAVADYLLNTPMKLIEHHHGASASRVVAWVRKSRHFKLRGMGGHARLPVASIRRPR